MRRKMLRDGSSKHTKIPKDGNPILSKTSKDLELSRTAIPLSKMFWSKRSINFQLPKISNLEPMLSWVTPDPLSAGMPLEFAWECTITP